MGFTTYTVAVAGTRRQLPALVLRLNAAINGLGRTDDLELRIAESADPDAMFSSLRIAGKNRDLECGTSWCAPRMSCWTGFRGTRCRWTDRPADSWSAA